MQRPWLSLAFALVAHGDLGSLLEPADIVSDAAPTATVAEHDEDARYDQLVQRSVHNAYARREPLVDQLAWHGVRSLELDVHARKGGVAAPPGDLFVYHADLPFARASSCATLSACLAQVRAFHDVTPGHDVITLFVDLKDAPATPNDARALDATLLRELGAEAVVTPHTLAARCPEAPSLREAVAACGFPTRRELRGKFLVVTTGGTSCDAKSPVRAYAGGAPLERAAFVAPDANAGCPVAKLDEPSRDHVVFVNLALDERARAREARARGIVSRVYGGGVLGGLDTPRELAAARRAGAQILATDAVNAHHDPWTLVGMTGSSEAREGVFTARSEGDGEVVEALATAPRSHADPRARVCLVARGREAREEAEVALCRPFAGEGTRFEVRDAAHVPLRVVARSAADAAFMRLRFEPASGGRGRVVAETSVDRRAWNEVGAVETRAPLTDRTFFVSHAL